MANLKLSILGIISALFICATGMAYHAQIYLKNNTALWNIQYRTTYASDPRHHEEKILKPGEKAMIFAEDLSIKRAGLGSSLTSSWTEVPLQKLLKENEHLAERGVPTIEINSGLTGWNFSVTFPPPKK